ncbi:MerR family DNA-binding transcriptional regulator [Burkholderia sp. FERM BP-3421]|jgi:DNA-binding transcriptional MerR regulator|uniref:MerR family DNA-binding transcriptional regulator n=1 Tax=Burkholderia sp. FERM BP-3421 TaxID=1494466 RepID=UPI003FCE1190
MKIGELAERTGLTPSRIRFYERIGLLTAVERQTNGYRAYSSDAVLGARSGRDGAEDGLQPR